MGVIVTQQASDPGLPDSIFTWRFDAFGGDSWGGTFVADSALLSPGDTLAGAQGTYRILSEEERQVDLSIIGLEDGQVFIDWYWDRQSGQFLPTRNGPGIASSLLGLGSELDAAWTGAAWVAFGLGGQAQADAAAISADTRFTWVFEAHSGDRWGGLLFAMGSDHDVGSTRETAAGVYRITAEEALGAGSPVAAGTVRLTGSYFDNASGLQLTIAGADGQTSHGDTGLGGEIATAWNGAAWMQFGLDGLQQIDAPPEMRPLVRGFGSEAGGWTSQDRYPRMLADVNGDGRADIVGFGNGGVLVSLATSNGGFGPSYWALDGFGYVAGGWASQDHYPRMLADVNGDGRADIVGFGNAGVLASLATPNGGFGPTRLALGEFGYVAGGWTSQDLYPRTMADINGDGHDDVIGFGRAGVWADWSLVLG